MRKIFILIIGVGVLLLTNCSEDLGGGSGNGNVTERKLQGSWALVYERDSDGHETTLDDWLGFTGGEENVHTIIKFDGNKVTLFHDVDAFFEGGYIYHADMDDDPSTYEYKISNGELWVGPFLQGDVRFEDGLLVLESNYGIDKYEKIKGFRD
jgi:hypothetical protein